MASLLERKLIVVTGKGGTGKTTVTCALGLLAARRGLRAIVVEFGDQHRLPALFGRSQTPESGMEVELEKDLWSTSIDPDKALFEWLRTVSGRISARMLATSSTFRYFAAAAPGAKELVSMVKVRNLCEAHTHDTLATSNDRREDRDDRRGYDLVILDAPATGHALAMLSSPRVFAGIVRMGPLAEQAQGVRELLEDRRLSTYVAVTHATEMAVTETLELEEGLRRQLDRDLSVVVVNGVLPRRFTREELARISAATEDRSPEEETEGTLGESTPLIIAAGRMARTVHQRARLQQAQIARLRRQRFAEGMPPGVVTLPFVFTPELDLAGVRELATRLDRRL
jgi:anion-transporting  ArsA/GET3 family ATPase